MAHTFVKWALDKLFMLNNHILLLSDCLQPPQMEVEVEVEPNQMDEIVVGFNDVGEILIERITRGTAQLDTVSIVGMGGLGKTTLAKKLYNSPFLRYHFHVRAFCNVGQEHSSKNILLEILNGLIVIDDEIRAMTKDDLAHRLYKCLKGHRYLIIMDDIWDVTAWKEVRDSFPDDNNRSRIVFTTRISNVALQAKKTDCSPHYLRFFTDEESWELLQAKVFHKHPCPRYLREVGMLIARKCNGLPLAVVVIAGLLTRIPRSQSSWNTIADDLNSYVSSSEGCMGTLELSYKHLPEALKSCLLYINGAIVKDKTITAKSLMLMWAAKGFLPERNSSSLAKQYLNDLVDRSLVIVHSRSSTGGIKRCSVHDLIRDLCQTKSQKKEQFFRLIRWRGPVYKQYFPISDCTVNCEEPFPYEFQPLQLLDVQVMDIYFPEEVTTLVNLRYLAIENKELTSAFGGRLTVPSTIGKLLKLETFILKTKGEVILPDTIWKMKRLRHVDVGKIAFVQLDRDVGKDSSKLPNVESFSCVTIAHGKYGEELLRRLSNARKLSCRFGSSWNQKRKLLKFDHHLTMLESLNIVSESLKEGDGYPYVFSFFPATIKKLSLSNFCLRWSEFATIICKQLPCLEVLKLMSNAFQGHTWDVKEVVFPSLKYLELNELDVVDWIASVDSFPCLERLIVKYCHELVEIPACFGDITTMKSIEVHSSNDGAKESAIQIQKEQLDMGNESLEVRVTQSIIRPAHSHSDHDDS